ncbi:hypothetical protein Bca52824_092438 [Brassica carinata]|uniref:Uncharacterized protein n=1 Tax=Brassica carinata TaxID=52824 RepID=A0A8X7NSR2_BRACI|nr:hypothetical protein Bca52824_092438 [Brassica carinata]
MASSDKAPVACPAGIGECKEPMGDPTKTTTAILEKGTAMMQSMKPIKQMSLHMFHIYGHRVNQDFLQCAVYESSSSKAHLIGIEYIVSEKLFEITPRIPELVAKPELKNLANSYGKFWCTWQFDRRKQLGFLFVLRDRLPLGVPSLMVSPQDVNLGRIKPELVKKRPSREGICGPEKKNMVADYWVRFRKGFALDVVETDMKKTAPFPRSSSLSTVSSDGNLLSLQVSSDGPFTRLFKPGEETGASINNNRKMVRYFKRLMEWLPKELETVKKDPVFAQIFKLFDNGLGFSARVIHGFLSLVCLCEDLSDFHCLSSTRLPGFNKPKENPKSYVLDGFTHGLRYGLWKQYQSLESSVEEN